MLFSRFASARLMCRSLLAGALVVLAVPIGGAARADDDATQLLKAMSDYVAAQSDFSFSYQSSLEAVTPTFEKLQFVSSGKVRAHRPDKIRVSRTGGFVDAELVFDGTTLTIHGKNQRAYAQVEAKGTLQDLGDRLADVGIDPPGGDLISADAFDALMDGVTEAKHISERLCRRRRMRVSGLPQIGCRLADLDRGRRASDPAALCCHQQGRRPGAAIHRADRRLERRRRRWRGRFFLQGAGRREEGRSERA